MRERTCADGAELEPSSRPSRSRATAFVTLGVARDGRAVMFLVRTPYRVRVPGRMRATPEIGLLGSVYTEGGPEASRIVDRAAAGEGGRERIAVMGSWEEDFHESDSLHEMWDVPNAVGVERR